MSAALDRQLFGETEDLRWNLGRIQDNVDVKGNLSEAIRHVGAINSIIPKDYIPDDQKNIITDFIKIGRDAQSSKKWYHFQHDQEKLNSLNIVGGLVIGLSESYQKELGPQQNYEEIREEPTHQGALPFPTPTSDLHESVNNIYQALGQNSPGYDIESEFEMLITELSEKRFYDQLVREGHVIQDKIFANENKDLEQPLNEEDKKVLRTYTKRVATKIRAHDRQTEIDLEVQRELE